LRDELEALAELQGIDREVKESKTTRTDLIAERQQWESQIVEKSAEVAALREQWQEKEAVRRSKEQMAQDATRKATDKRMRMTLVKNVKELQALQREISQIKESNAILEEEILEVMSEVETQGSVLKQKEEELKELEDEWNARKASLEGEIAKVDESIAETSKVREATASRLNGDLVGRYELIFSRRDGTAVVSVSSGICEACHMNIPPQLWNEVLRSERVNLCPSCQRILYYNPPPGDGDGNE